MVLLAFLWVNFTSLTFWQCLIWGLGWTEAGWRIWERFGRGENFLVVLVLLAEQPVVQQEEESPARQGGEAEQGDHREEEEDGLTSWAQAGVRQDLTCTDQSYQSITTNTTTTFNTGAIATTPPWGADTVVLRGSWADCVVVSILALEVVFTVLAQGGGGNTVAGEVHSQVWVTLANSGVEGAPAAQLPGLTPPLVSGQTVCFVS